MSLVPYCITVEEVKASKYFTIITRNTYHSTNSHETKREHTQITKLSATVRFHKTIKRNIFKKEKIPYNNTLKSQYVATNPADTLRAGSGE